MARTTAHVTKVHRSTGPTRPKTRKVDIRGGWCTGMWLARVRSERRQMAPPGRRKHLVSLSAALSPRHDRGPDFDRSHKLVLQLPRQAADPNPIDHTLSS
jgi:hypothetical protein